MVGSPARAGWRVLLLGVNQTPNLIASNAAGRDAAHMLVVVFERRFAGILQQLVDGVDRAADDSLPVTTSCGGSDGLAAGAELFG
jgi:hypothetical protein